MHELPVWGTDNKNPILNNLVSIYKMRGEAKNLGLYELVNKIDESRAKWGYLGDIIHGEEDERYKQLASEVWEFLDYATLKIGLKKYIDMYKCLSVKDPKFKSIYQRFVDCDKDLDLNISSF